MQEYMMNNALLLIVTDRRVADWKLTCKGGRRELPSSSPALYVECTVHSLVCYIHLYHYHNILPLPLSRLHVYAPCDATLSCSHAPWTDLPVLRVCRPSLQQHQPQHQHQQCTSGLRPKLVLSTPTTQQLSRSLSETADCSTSISYQTGHP